MSEESPVRMIKRFFEAGPYGRKVELEELKALSTEDRKELAELISKEGEAAQAS